MTLGPPQNLGRTAPRPCLCLTPYTLGPVSRPQPWLPNPFLLLVAGFSSPWFLSSVIYTGRRVLSILHFRVICLMKHYQPGPSMCMRGTQLPSAIVEVLACAGHQPHRLGYLWGARARKDKRRANTHTHTYTLGVSCPPWCLLHQGAVASPFQGQGLPGQSHSWPQLSRGGCSVPVWWGGWSLAVKIPGRGQSLRASPTAA